MLHQFPFSCSKPASIMKFSSPLLINNTSFQLSKKFHTCFSFPYKPLYQHALRSVLPASASFSSPLIDTTKESKSMNEFLNVELEVRDNKLNKYGVVHNHLYSSYCQQGCINFLESIGIDYNGVVENGDSWAMSELSLKFIAPLRRKDKFILKVRVSSFSAVRLYFHCFIYKQPNQQPILEARVTVVQVNQKNFPIPISTDMKFKIVKFIGGDVS